RNRVEATGGFDTKGARFMIHSIAATVVTTAFASAGAATIVNQMATDRWRRTKRLFARLLGGGDATRGAAAEAELDAYALLVERASDAEQPELRAALMPVLRIRLEGLLAEQPGAAAELKALLARLDVSVEAAAHQEEAAEEFAARAPELDALVRQAGSPESSAARATTLNRLGGVRWRLGDFAAAVKYYRLALILARREGDRHGEGHALNNLGTAYDHLGQYGEAQAVCQQALEIHRATGDTHAEALTLSNLGAIHEHLDADVDAESFYRQALELHRRTDDRFCVALVLGRLGALHHRLGDLAAAEEARRRALDICRELGDRETEVDLLNGQAETLCAMGSLHRSMVVHARALTLAGRLGDVREQARAHHGIAGLLSLKGDGPGARTHWYRAWRIFTDLDDPRAAEARAGLDAITRTED
ncbi:tetratricopeptide repeat protein, partial [Stackebrandtia sp.]|uniref:tetratricopeptide repeat protein n=1 Tax=Stackebrandtia sp. TaxID=2023065 RepID=UPI002D7A3270